MKPSRPAIPASLAVLLVIAVILVWQIFRTPDASPTYPAQQQQLQSTSIASSPPVSPPIRVSELRGRRGIIEKLINGSIVMKTTDSYATLDERVTVQISPATSFVLITIPKAPHRDQETVIRTPAQLSDLSIGNDIFVISFKNIIASSTFSALRIEKIITP